MQLKGIAFIVEVLLIEPEIKFDLNWRRRGIKWKISDTIANLGRSGDCLEKIYTGEDILRRHERSFSFLIFSTNIEIKNREPKKCFFCKDIVRIYEIFRI